MPDYMKRDQTLENCLIKLISRAGSDRAHKITTPASSRLPLLEKEGMKNPVSYSEFKI